MQPGIRPGGTGLVAMAAHGWQILANTRDSALVGLPAPGDSLGGQFEPLPNPGQSPFVFSRAPLFTLPTPALDGQDLVQSAAVAFLTGEAGIQEGRCQLAG